METEGDKVSGTRFQYRFQDRQYQLFFGLRFCAGLNFTRSNGDAILLQIPFGIIRFQIGEEMAVQQLHLQFFPVAPSCLHRPGRPLHLPHLRFGYPVGPYAAIGTRTDAVTEEFTSLLFLLKIEPEGGLVFQLRPGFKQFTHLPGLRKDSDLVDDCIAQIIFGLLPIQLRVPANVQRIGEVLQIPFHRLFCQLCLVDEKRHAFPIVDCSQVVPLLQPAFRQCGAQLLLFCGIEIKFNGVCPDLFQSKLEITFGQQGASHAHQGPGKHPHREGQFISVHLEGFILVDLDPLVVAIQIEALALVPFHNFSPSHQVGRHLVA